MKVAVSTAGMHLLPSSFGYNILGRPLGYLIFSLMALIRGPYILIFFNGFQGPT